MHKRVLDRPRDWQFAGAVPAHRALVDIQLPRGPSLREAGGFQQGSQFVRGHQRLGVSMPASLIVYVSAWPLIESRARISIVGGFPSVI